MGKRLLVFAGFVRNFHTSTAINGSAIKTKVEKLQKYGVVMERTAREQRKVQAKKDIILKNKRQSAYSKQKAKHILQTKYGFDDSIEVGPTSNSDVEALLLTKDKRLLTTVLGTNLKQLKDSKLVAKDVATFCKRGQLQKAIFLTKMSGKKGVVAANLLMQHYLKVEKDVKSAFYLYNFRKKWQIPPNEYTENILFDGLSKLKSAVTEKVAQKILKIVQQLIENNRLNKITFNSALSALSSCPNPKYTFQCYDLRPKGIEKDSITYTRLLIACTKYENSVEAIQKADWVMGQINVKNLDSQLFFHYVNVWHSRPEKDFFTCVLPLIDNFFAASALSKYPFVIPDFINLPTLDSWGLIRPFSMDEYVLHLLLENCLKSGHYLTGIEYAQECFATDERFITEKNVTSTIRLITKQYPFDCAYKCAEFYNFIENTGTLRDMILPLIHTYKAFERQSLKKRTNDNYENASKLVKSFIDFAREKESIVVISEDEGNKVSLKWKPWMFIWNVVKQCEGSLSIVERKQILNEFLNTKLYDNSMDPLRREAPKSDLRFVYLEAIRFINRLEQSLTLQEEELVKIKTEKEKNESLEKKRFLLKRHLLRLRKGLLEIVEEVEGKIPSGEGQTKESFDAICNLVLTSNIQ